MDTTNYKVLPIDFDPFEDGEIEQIIPAIEPQQEIWLACIIGGDPANCAYNESVSLRLNGELDIVALEKALYGLVKRRDALRCSFSADGEKVYIYKDVRIELRYDDLSPLHKAEQEAQLTNYAHEDAGNPFDLSKGPLIRPALFKLAPTDFLLRITVHHIICDGWSFGVILEDIALHYNAYLQGLAISFSAPDELKSFTLKTLRFSQSALYKRTETYWLKKFETKIPVTELPTDYHRPSRRTYRGNRIDQVVDRELVMAIKNLGKSLGCSLVNTLLATFEVLVHRITGKQSMVIGLPASGQVAYECYDLVGHCVNFLPLSVHVNPDLTIEAYIKARRSELLTDYEYQQITFGSLIKKLNVPRNTGQTPLVSVVFNVDMGMDEKVSFHGLQHQLISNPRTHENFDLFFNVSGSEESLSFEWSYNTDIFKDSTIRKWMHQFAELMAKVAADPSSKIKDLDLAGTLSTHSPLLDGGREDAHGLTEQFAVKPEGGMPMDDQYSSVNAHRDAPYEEAPISTTLVELINGALEQYAELTALQFRDQQLSYTELDKRSNQFANFLLSQGILPGDRIGLSLYRGFDLVVAVVATLKLGATYMPLDITFPVQRLRHILERANLKSVLFNRDFSDRFDMPSTIRICLEEIPALNAYSDERIHIEARQDALAYVLHTSGSTGMPKGVAMGQKALTNLLLWQRSTSRASLGTKTLQFSPITFDVSFQEIFSTLTTGGTLCLIDEEMRYDIQDLLKHVQSEGINRVFMPFVALQGMAENGCANQLYPACIQEVITAGEQLKVTEQVAQFFSSIPHATLSNQYGPTETHVVTELKLQGPAPLWPPLPSVGKPIHNARILLLDESMRPVEWGEVGELCVSGVPLADGYIGSEELTNERFLTIDLPEGVIRVYRTGDLARYGNDGNIVFLGRRDAQVKIRGYRVELGEIEVQLTKMNGIIEAVVNMVEDVAGHDRLVAYVLMDVHSHKITKETLVETGHPIILDGAISSGQALEWRKQLADLLPEYMMPYDFVAMDRFPLTKSGKIDRKALPDPKNHLLKRVDSQYVAPRNPTEAFIAKIWERVLGLDLVSVTSDFFELGGYSLIAVKVMLAIEKETGKRLPIGSFFENSTIEKLSKLIRKDTNDTKWTRLVPIKPTGTKPPLYIVHGAGLEVMVFQRLVKFVDPEQPIYGLQAKGVDGKETPSETIEEVAADYIAEILQHNPDGPYAIAGYSSGGIVAFEMTKQLHKAGKEVFFLGLFDSYAYSNAYKILHGEAAIASYLLRKWLFMGILLFRNPKVYIMDKFYYLRGILYSAYKKVFPEARLFEEPSEYLKNVQTVHLSAHKRYKMEPYHCHAHLFRAEIKTVYSPNFKSNAWEPFLLDGLAIHEIPGHHLSVFEPPGVQILGKKLQECLDASQESTHRTKRGQIVPNEFSSIKPQIVPQEDSFSI